MTAPVHCTARKGKACTASPGGALAHAKLSIISSLAGAAVQRSATSLGTAGGAGGLPTSATHASVRFGRSKCGILLFPIFWPQSTVLPNPSLNRTRYGSRRLAAPGHSAHCPCAASRRLPQRAG